MTLTVKQAYGYYLAADASYPVCEEFMSKGYRQKRGGYLASARNGSPDAAVTSQRDHILSYIDLSYADGTIPSGEYPFVRCLRRIRCAELLIFCAEAVGMDVRRACEEAAAIIDSKVPYARVKAAKRIKELLTPEAICMRMEK